MSSDHDHKVRTLWLAGILHAFTHVYQMALIPLYLLIQRGLKLESVEQSTLLVTVMGMAYFLPSYPQGVLADKFSRKKLLALGLAINGLGFVCLGCSPNFACALVSVVVAGLGGSFYHPAATALIARLYPAKTGRALGLVAIGSGVGFFLSPIYAGWRAEATGNWRYPVVEMGVAGMIFSGIFYWLAEEEHGGAVIAKARARGHKLFPTKSLWGIFLLMSLVLSLRDFAGSGLGSLTSLFLQKAHGMNAKTTGFMVSGIYLAAAAGSPLFGRLSDGGRVRWAVGLIFISMVVVALLPLVPRDGMFAVLAVFGFFYMATYPVIEAAVMEAVPDAVRGRVFGLFITFGGLFGNMAHWAMGAWVKNLGASAALPASYRLLYDFLALTLLLSLLGLPGLHAIRKREHVHGHVTGGAEPAALATAKAALK